MAEYVSSLPAAPVPRTDPRWVGADGYYARHDFWLSLCGLYAQYGFALAQLGDLRGKAVLDCGCGHGQTSIMLARHGARVTAFDTSEQDLARARELAEANDAHIDFRPLSFEELPFAEGSFDAAFGSCILHHVDIPEACRQLARVLRPGARAMFIENSARNPLLMAARRRLVGRIGIPRYGDDHEHPLTPDDLNAIGSTFAGRMQVHHPDFLFFRLADFYVLQKRAATATRLLAFADRLCGRIPGVNRYGYFQVIQLDRS